jgi:hypothetical protein
MSVEQPAPTLTREEEIAFVKAERDEWINDLRDYANDQLGVMSKEIDKLNTLLADLQEDRDLWRNRFHNECKLNIANINAYGEKKEALFHAEIKITKLEERINELGKLYTNDIEKMKKHGTSECEGCEQRQYDNDLLEQQIDDEIDAELKSKFYKIS